MNGAVAYQCGADIVHHMLHKQIQHTWEQSMGAYVTQGKARGMYSLHMFLSWLYNLEKHNHEQELAAFKETTVWQVRAAA